MERTDPRRVPAKALLPFLKHKIDELGREASSPRVTGERAAYRRLSLMAHVPFRSLARLRSQCEAHTWLVDDGAPYSDGLQSGYRTALAEIERAFGEARASLDA